MQSESCRLDSQLRLICLFCLIWCFFGMQVGQRLQKVHAIESDVTDSRTDPNMI